MRVVVDTDILRAANDSSHNAFARLCAKILSLILNNDKYRVVICREILREWFSPPTESATRRNRLSTWSHLWYYRMHSLKKLYMLKDNEHPIDSLCNELLICLPTPEVASKVKKDCPFIIAAVQTDNIIISNNTRERGHLARACRQPCSGRRLIAELKWLVPSESAFLWLNGEVTSTDFAIC